MPLPLPKPATYDDILALPEHVVGEIIDGERFVSPRPAPRLATASSVIGADLVGRCHRRPGDPRGPGGWWILDEPELHVTGHVLVPDLADWRREHMAELPTTAYFDLAPDWVCEVVSPKSRRLDRMKKMPKYAEMGVTWLSWSTRWCRQSRPTNSSQKKPIKFAVSILLRHCQPPRITVLRQAS